MKKHITHIISLVLLTFFYGCSQEEIQVTLNSGDGESRTLTLTLTNIGMASRAKTINGDPNLNENLINRVDLFLYPKDGTSSNAVFTQSFPFTVTEGKDGNVTLTCNVPMDKVNLLFPIDDTTKKRAEFCEAYAIVNRPADSNIPTETESTTPKTDIISLKAIPITSSLESNAAQTEFVMDGYSTDITYSDDAISGSIAADRSAAKITLTITEIENELVDEGGTTWRPLPTEMKVMFYNGVNISQVNTDAYILDNTDGYFNLTGSNARSFVGTTSGETTVAPYKHATPFYSYPSDWGEAAKNNEAHMILMLPWIHEDGTNRTNFYYEVPINEDGKKLVRNTYYQINLVVGILGSTELTDEIVKLNPTCILLNWGKEEINAELDQPRYLVAEDTIRIYNQNSVNIPFESSHPISSTISVSECYHQELVNGNNENRSAEGTLRINGNNVVYTRELDNNFTHASQSLGGTFDFTPYYTTFTIKQDGDTDEELSKTITIIQYPAIYGTRQVNSDYPDSQNYGFAFVNGYNKGFSRDNQDNFDPIQGSPSGNGVSSNAMLIFTVTSTEGTDYIIGDPRELLVNQEFINTTHTVSNKSYSIWDSAPSLYGESPRYLQNYYATETNHNNLRNASSTAESRIDEDETPLYNNEAEAIANERTYNMIAPKFRISSGYGAVSATQVERRYYDMMKKRCASYQEDGYPAGRWRLPTMAEFKFIIYLSYHGKIPQLFSPTMPYWCAHGFGKANNENVTPSFYTDYGGTGISVRCVYDDWYWGSEPVLKTEAEKNTFTWGDQPREQ